MSPGANRPSLRLVQPGISVTPVAEDAIIPVLDRLIAILDEESDSVLSGQRVDYRDFNARKSQGLLEITRIEVLLKSACANAAASLRMRQAIAALERNERALSVQLRAARQLSDAIARAVIEGQSDGTYSERAWSRFEE